MGAGGDVTGRAAAPQQLLDEGLADAKQCGDGPLGADSLVTGTEDLLSKVERIGFHVCEHSASTPYKQLITAVSNGKILPKDFGHLASGYYITSWSGQSKTVDKVLIAEGEESFKAANLEQFYVSCTRGREACRIYTDEKDALRERIVHSSQRGTATELLAGRVAANTRPRDVTERAMKDRDRLRKRAYKGKYATVVESQRNRIAVGEGRRRGEWFEGLVQQRPGPDIGR
jgi:hypothetical protein